MKANMMQMVNKVNKVNGAGMLVLVDNVHTKGVGASIPLMRMMMMMMMTPMSEPGMEVLGSCN